MRNAPVQRKRRLLGGGIVGARDSGTPVGVDRDRQSASSVRYLREMALI
jgi:hypothetical protein